MGKVIELNRTESIFNSKLTILDWGTFRRIFFSDIKLEEWIDAASKLVKKFSKERLREYFNILFDEEFVTRKKDYDSSDFDSDFDSDREIENEDKLFKTLKSSLKIIVSYMKNNYSISEDVKFDITLEDGVICIKTKRKNFIGSNISSSSSSRSVIHKMK